MEMDLSSASIYTEFSGLSKLKLAAKNQTPEAIETVANQLEAFFLKLMLKQMRDSSLAEGAFDSDKSRFYQDMMDHQLALNLAEKRTVGIADSIIKQLQQAVPKGAAEITFNPLPDRQYFPDISAKANVNRIRTQASFDSPEAFIDAMRPYAEKAAEELGVPTSVLLAQSALETGWGQKIMKNRYGHSSHNLFGIKADSRWSGDSVSVSSLEYRGGKAKREVSAFRAYESFQESFNDYVQFIKSNDRYRSALKQADDNHSYIHALQDAGYATDPHYADKVMNIIKRELI